MQGKWPDTRQSTMLKKYIAFTFYSILDYTDNIL